MSAPIVVLSPCLEDREADALRERMVARGLSPELLRAPSDPGQSLPWRAAAREAVARAARTLVVEPTIDRDPEGLYRRELTTLLAGLTPAARALCVPCSLSREADAVDPSGARPVLAGPLGRPALDLARPPGHDRLEAILAREPLKAKGLSLAGLRSVVLSDHAAERDGIGLEGAASALVDLISAESTTPPVVASIEGSWGIGKSSFLGLVRAELRRRGWAGERRAPADPARRDPPRLRTVWFNAWSNDSEASAFASFALSLIAELEGVNPLARLRLRLRLTWSRLDVRKGWKDGARLAGGVLLLLLAVGVAVLTCVPGFKGWLRQEVTSLQAVMAGLTGVVGVTGLKQILHFFSSPFDVDLAKHLRDPDHDGKRSPRDLLYDDIAKIIDVYSRDVQRLYVFIDDLDRAEPSKVVEIMQTISVLLARAGGKLVYVLAMDREKVAGAIAAKHKEIAALMSSVGSRKALPLDFGQAFLEKFVQLPFRVPTADVAKLRSWVEGLLPEGHELGEVVGMVAPFLGANPRRIKQFVNLMHLRLHILKTQDTPASGLSLHQLGKITAAELLYPFFIDDLIAAPTLLNALLLGAGAAVESESYRRWSAHSELLALLSATLPAAPEPLALLQADRDASLLDVDLGPILRVVARPGAAVTAPSPAAAERSTRDTDPSPVAAETAHAVLVRYANEYERIRATEPSGAQRTAKMDRLFDDMVRVRGVSKADVDKLISSGAAGARIAVLASFFNEMHPSTGGTLLQVLEQPSSMFEVYHALRVARRRWPELSSSDRRAMVLLLSKQWINGSFKDDPPIMHMAGTILNLAKDEALGDDLQVLLPEGVALRLSGDEIKSFTELTTELYSALASRVRAYHYGTDWRLLDGDTRLLHARELAGAPPGTPVLDSRSLGEAGVRPGARLRVELLNPPREAPPAPDASP